MYSKMLIFKGFTGTVIINQNSTRDPVFYLWGINSTDLPMVMMIITGSLDPTLIQVRI